MELTSVIGLLDVTRRIHSGWLGPSLTCMPLKMACADTTSSRMAEARTFHIFANILVRFTDGARREI